MTELLYLLPLLLFNCLWCVGFNAVTWYDFDESRPLIPYNQAKSIDSDSKMLLWFIRFYSVKWLGAYNSKPICLCLPCMASIHSLWFWAFNPLSWHSALIYILYAIALAGLNKIVMVKFDL